MWEQAKSRVLAGIVDNPIYIKKESVRRFEIGRDKKNLVELACRMKRTERERKRGREKGSCSIHVDVLLKILLVFFSFSFVTLKISLTKEKLGMSNEEEIIINASTWALAFGFESWWNELALRRKRVEKKAGMTLPSAGERRVTSNQNSDEDWLVDGDVTCGMSKKGEEEEERLNKKKKKEKNSSRLLKEWKCPYGKGN